MNLGHQVDLDSGEDNPLSNVEAPPEVYMLR